MKKKEIYKKKQQQRKWNRSVKDKDFCGGKNKQIQIFTSHLKININIPKTEESATIMWWDKFV